MEIATRRVVHKYKGRRLVLENKEYYKYIDDINYDDLCMIAASYQCTTSEEGRRRGGIGEGAR